jgi:hypothetical protein
MIDELLDFYMGNGFVLQSPLLRISRIVSLREGTVDIARVGVVSFDEV